MLYQLSYASSWELSDTSIPRIPQMFRDNCKTYHKEIAGATGIGPARVVAMSQTNYSRFLRAKTPVRNDNGVRKVGREGRKGTVTAITAKPLPVCLSVNVKTNFVIPNGRGPEGSVSPSRCKRLVKPPAIIKNSAHDAEAIRSQTINPFHYSSMCSPKWRGRHGRGRPGHAGRERH